MTLPQSADAFKPDLMAVASAADREDDWEVFRVAPDPEVYRRKKEGSMLGSGANGKVFRYVALQHVVVMLSVQVAKWLARTRAPCASSSLYPNIPPHPGLILLANSLFPICCPPLPGLALHSSLSSPMFSTHSRMLL